MFKRFSTTVLKAKNTSPRSTASFKKSVNSRTYVSPFPRYPLVSSGSSSSTECDSSITKLSGSVPECDSPATKLLKCREAVNFFETTEAPTKSQFAKCVKRCQETKQHELALRIVKAAQGHNMSIGLYCSVRILKTCSGNHAWKACLDILKVRSSEDLLPSSTTYDIVLNAFVNSGEADECFRVMQEALAQDFTLEMSSYEVVLKLQQQAGNAHRISEVQSLMAKVIKVEA